MHTQAESERRDLVSQLERARREAGSAARERRDALAKAGQQKREGKEAADALQVGTWRQEGNRMQRLASTLAAVMTDAEALLREKEHMGTMQ
jgi:hypothetical protein